MPQIQLQDIIPISEFVRNSSEHAKRIRETGRGEILTQHGKPSLAVIPAEDYEKLLEQQEYWDTVEAINNGFVAADKGEVTDADDFFNEWSKENDA